MDNEPRTGNLGARLRFMAPVKVAGVAVGMAAFLKVYFVLLNRPAPAVWRVPATPVDRWIAFQPDALVIYLSLWFYVSCAPALLKSWREMAVYAGQAILLGAIGLSIFRLWPSVIPDSGQDWSGHPAFAFLKRVDNTGNAFPSMHVAFAVFSAIWIHRALREMGAARAVRFANVLWCAAIAYSTLATRQHVFLDAASGAVLGAVITLLPMGWSGSSRDACSVRKSGRPESVSRRAAPPSSE